MSIEETLAEIGDVRGWLTDAQARRLFACASRLPGGATVVEIGSYHGRSTIVLARGAPASELVVIDPYTGAGGGEADLAEFRANVDRAGLSGRVRHVRSTSRAAVDEVSGPVDLLYVDGAHDIRSAFGDVRSWGSRVAEGGTMFVHDAFSAIGVTVAQVGLLFASRHYRYLGRSRSLAEYRREDVSGLARARNCARQLAQLPWFVRNVLVKVGLTTRMRWLCVLLRHHDDVYPY